MGIDYSKGQYIVVGPDGQQVGLIDEDGFVRSGARLICRIDGDEVYEVNGSRLLGFIDSGVARKPNGEHLFTIRSE